MLPVVELKVKDGLTTSVNDHPQSLMRPTKHYIVNVHHLRLTQAEERSTVEYDYSATRSPDKIQLSQKYAIKTIATHVHLQPHCPQGLNHLANLVHQ